MKRKGNRRWNTFVALLASLVLVIGLVPAQAMAEAASETGGQPPDAVIEAAVSEDASQGSGGTSTGDASVGLNPAQTRDAGASVGNATNAQGESRGDAEEHAPEGGTAVADARSDADGPSSEVSADDADVKDAAVEAPVGKPKDNGESEADDPEPSESPEPNEEPELTFPAFDQSRTVNGVAVRVSADEDVFSEGAALSVVAVSSARVESAIEGEREAGQTVAVSFTFDIKVLDADGNELQPADGQSVRVSFAAAQVADQNLDTQVYHVSEDGSAEALDVVSSGQTATVETDGFSYYTVEFTYNDLQYVLSGGESVALSEVLDEVGLTGEVTAVQCSNTSLFSASEETGEWVLTSHQPFSTTEKMSVTIEGIEYEITVTDAGILFMCAASGGKTTAEIGSGAFGSFRSSSDDGMKFTIQDDNRTGFAAEFTGTDSATAATVAPGGTVDVKYSGAATGDKQFVSAFIHTLGATPQYYASLTPASTGAGTWTMTIPDDLDGTYLLRVFSEQQSGDHLTDYAGNLVTLTLTVQPVTTYPLWVGGEQVADTNKDDILGDGTVSFNSDSNTLTLNNATITGTFNPPSPDIGTTSNIFTTLGSLTVALEGANSLSGGRVGIFSHGLVTISGGSLNVTGDFVGIEANDGITIENSVVSASGGMGIVSTVGSVTINNSTVEAKATTSEAIHGQFGITITGVDLIEPAGGGIDQGHIIDSSGYAATYVLIGAPCHVTYMVANGTWSDGTNADKYETVAKGLKPTEVPTGMLAAGGFTGGSWNTDPAAAAITGATTFTYSFEPLPSYTVSVVGGTSDKATARAGETVAITADEPEEGYAFNQWAQVDGVDFDNASAAQTTFAMPAKDVTITAVFPEIILPAIGDQTYTGQAIEPTFGLFDVKLDGVDGIFVKDTHYSLSYSDNKDVGEATVTLTMLAPRTGSKTVTFQITPADITEAEISDIADQEYAGAAIAPEPKVTWNGKTLVKDTDYTLSYAKNVDVGTAEVTVASKDKGNFTGTKTATFRITPKPLTITAEAKSKTYGNADPELTYTAEGLADGDTISGKLTRTEGENVGAYAINQGTLTAGDNYAISFTGANLTIGQRPLTITALPQTFTYNGQTQGEADTAYDDLADIAEKVSVSSAGLRKGDELASVKLDGQGTDAASYELVASNASVVDSAGNPMTSNYDITYVPGTLTIESAKSTITVDSASKAEGEGDPIFTGTVEGLVDEGDLGEVKFVRTGDDEAPGTYTGVLTATYDKNPNYNVTVVPGDFSIKTVYTLRWLDGDGSVLQEKTYAEGDEAPVFDGEEPTKAATAQYSYAFSGWDEGTVEGTTTTYAPQFDATVNEYDITLDLAGGKLDGQAGTVTWTRAYGSVVTLPEPTRAGYEFQFWEGSRYDAGDEYTVEGTHTFTAVWEEEPALELTTFTVSFDANGHGKAPAAQEVEDGKTATKPADPTADGWTFGGWFTDKDCTKAYDFSKPVTADVKLYAKWTQEKSPSPSPTKPTPSIPQTGDPYAGIVALATAIALASGICLVLAGVGLRRKRGAHEK